MQGKAVLEFKLDEEKYYAELALNAVELALFISEIKEFFRGKHKYSPERETNWTEVYDEFNRMYTCTKIQDLVERMP